jgi:hypothetical protein
MIVVIQLVKKLNKNALSLLSFKDSVSLRLRSLTSSGMTSSPKLIGEEVEENVVFSLP